MSLLVQSLAGLGHMVIVLLVRGHIDHVIGNHRIFGVSLVNFPVGSFNKTIFIDSRIACKIIDQTDIRSFGSLYGAHSAIVRIVHVPDLKSGTVSGQTAGSQRGQTSLVGQLCQRIVLVHELRQLGGTEEFLHSRGHRLDIDQCLGRRFICVMCGHSLSDHALHPGQSDPVLVLQQLTH